MTKRLIGLLLLAAVWVGGGSVAHGAEQITISPKSPPTIDFGNVRVAGSAVATRAFTITNTGTSGSTLTITNITFDDAEYRVNPALTFPINLARSATQSVVVEFNPTSAGAHPATMTVVNSDTTNEGVALTGTGTTAIISVTDVDFLMVDDTTTSSKTIAVTNTATMSPGILTVTTATIAGSGFFKFGNGLGCNGGTTCTFSPALAITNGTSNVPVVCSPPAAASGTGTATVTFASDSDPGGTSVSQLTCVAGRPNLVLSSNTLTFDSIPVGNSQTKTVMLSNNGNTQLAYSVSKVPNASQYVITGCTSGCTLAPAASATLTVVFTPDGPGTLTMQINIVSNDPDPGESTQSIAVSGIGKQGVLTVTPTSHDFGGTAVNTTTPFNFTLANTGNVTVTGIQALTPSGAGTGYVFDPTSVPATLAPNAQVTLTVAFAPTTTTDGGSKTFPFQGSWSDTGVTAPSNAAFTVTGQGLSVNYAVSPQTKDFGSFRFDTPPSQIITVTNNGTATLGFSATFTPDAGTQPSEYSFDVRRPGSSTILTLPQSLSPAQQLEITATPRPSNRIGAVGGQLKIHPNTGPDITVTLSGNATSAGVSAAAVAFGDVDVDGAPPSQMLTISDTGVAPLDVTSFSIVPGGSAAFHLTLPTASTQVAPGTPFTLPVSYAPTAALPAGQMDQLVVIAHLAGIAGGPTQAMITLTGRGIDRNLSVAPVDTFDPAFRNPGSKAPTEMITVTNTGEAPLVISNAMITAGSPIWQLAQQPFAPLTIPGGQSQSIGVKFAPTELGAAPPGTLILVNNDNARPIQMITLNGSAVRRNVSFGPDLMSQSDIQTLDLGVVGVGVPATKTNLLAVANLDASHGFTIREIAFAAPGGQPTGGVHIQLVSAQNNVDLPAGMTKRFSLAVEATQAGPIDMFAQLYLDEDPTVHAMVHLTGTAVGVEAGGGGGCSTGRNSGGGAALALGILAFGIGGRWRRRARSARRSAATAAAAVATSVVTALGAFGLRRRRAQATLAVAAFAVVTAVAPEARADDIGISVFEPTPAINGTGFQLQSPEVGSTGNWAFSTVLSYASDPLVLNNTIKVVDRSTLLQLGFAYAFLGRFEAAVRIPLYMQHGDGGDPNGNGLTATPASGTATGDIALHAKARLWRGGSGKSGTLALGAAGSLVLPTASKAQFTGSGKPELRLLALGAFTPAALAARLTLSANLGPIVRGTSGYADVEQGSGLAWGLGASFRVLDPVSVTAELFGEATPSGKTSMDGASTLAPIEWLLGLNLRAERRFTVGIAAGRGATSAIGTPDLRGVLSLAFVPGASAVAPVGSDRPDGDADGDGVRDSVDKCPNEPEDRDGFQDEDGCPDPDNDRDGIPDALDKCPNEPEDKDGFQDDDGCPDPDNDGDGVPDALDKCPNQPEDKDGFEDSDGCPDPDNDHDGIADAKDKCPNEPETINGFQDEDGCPDRGDSTIVLSPDRIETLDPIQFTGLKLTRTSLPVLGQIAATLRAHPEIVRLRITVHVQPTQDTAADQTRSEKRAQAIRDWLVQWGIAPARVEARGFGSSKPLVSPDQRGAAKINDRTEMIILERN
jgi:hypothetical protein